MTVLTEHGRAAAIAALHERRARNKDRPRVDNGKLPAGSPMFFACLACGETIVVEEGYLTKPDFCRECAALRRIGWLVE